MRVRLAAARPAVIALAATLGACGGLPEGGSGHPVAGQAEDAFSIAERRCAAQGKTPAVSLRDPIRGVRIGGHQVYRSSTLTCVERPPE